jgi:hypothetical protein
LHLIKEKKMAKSSYDKDIQIDKNNLSEEWEKQGGLYLHYALKLSKAERSRNNAKEEMEVVKARIDKDIRKNPSAYGYEKVTESIVSNTIILEEDHKEATENYIDSCYEVGVLQAVVRAFDHKKKALENLVTLHMGGYNAEPKNKQRRST